MELETGIQVGRTDDGIVVVYVRTVEGLTPEKAREVAAALLEHADAIDPPATVNGKKRRLARR